MAVISKLSVSLTANTKGLERGLKRAQRKVKAFTNDIFSIKTAVAGALGIGGIGAIVGDLVSVNSEMQRLKSGLKTVTGSAENAATAFDFIKQFSVTTPFELNEVTSAFVKLKAYGLDPSERALRAYGNTASAMGKSLDQMIEAVADATTGEFERLKEFGIRASKQGDQVTFTFKGVEQTVKLNAEAIQGYLTSLSEQNFGSAMADQMNNLSPAFSNLRTAFQDLKISIGEAGLNAAITDLINNTTQWINTLDRAQIEQWTKSALNGFADLASGIGRVYEYVSGNQFLAWGGILGYMLFGAKGVALVALIDQVNAAFGRDVAKIWENLTPSGITGGQAGGMEGYRLGLFNESGGSRAYAEQLVKMQEKYGSDQVNEQEKTNSILEGIAETLRSNANGPAVAM